MILFNGQVNYIEMKETAVEWLVDKLEIFATEEEMNIIDQAKAMEKEQSFEIFKAGQESMEEGGKGFEQYYNEIYKSE